MQARKDVPAFFMPHTSNSTSPSDNASGSADGEAADLLRPPITPRCGSSLSGRRKTDLGVCVIFRRCCGDRRKTRVARCLLCFSFLAAAVFLALQHRETKPRSVLTALLSAREPCEGNLEMKGIASCPGLQAILPLLLENKRNLLRLATDATEDAGEKNPLMLTSHLIGKVTDVYFSSSGSGDDKVVGWYEEHGHDVRLAQDRSSERFLDVVDSFYAKKVPPSRPVVVYVTGSHVCALWDELSPGETASSWVSIEPAQTSSSSTSIQSAATAVAEGKTPLALVTLGWDGNGSPFAVKAFSACAHRILELPQVVRWFVSHGKIPARTPKVQFVAIGFGGSNPRSGLRQEQYVMASAKKLRELEICEVTNTMEVLFMCNNDSAKTGRQTINAALKKQTSEESRESGPVDPRVIPENHYPLEPAETVVASTQGLFAISPPGTRADCFRHYEYLLAGNIVYVPDHPSLRDVLAGLPVVFVQGGSAGWGRITCESMVEHARQVSQRLRDGLRPGAEPPFLYAKLMLSYWTRFVRDRVWLAGAETQGVPDSGSAMRNETDTRMYSFPEMVVGHG